MFIKRLFDIFFSIMGLFLLIPFFIIIALLIKLDSKGTIIFKQTRVGLNGKYFHIWKFRTMVENAENKGTKITMEKDARITKIGTFLRKYKLDELPQLVNILKGDMSFVGPRPEVPEYVKYYPEEIKKIVLSVAPGITDKASIKFKDESKILSNSDNPLKVYREEILPIKWEYAKDYVLNRSFFGDISLIFSTIYAVIR